MASIPMITIELTADRDALFELHQSSGKVLGKDIMSPDQPSLSMTDNLGLSETSVSSLQLDAAASTSSPCIVLAPPTPLTFRPDLDEAEQRMRVRRDTVNAMTKAQMDDWRTTFASKQDHAMFLKMLVTEAHRQSPDMVSVARAKRLIRLVHRLELESERSDPYLNLINIISAEHLFLRSPTATGVPAGVPVTSPVAANITYTATKHRSTPLDE